MAPKPEDRFRSAAEFSEAFAASVEAKPPKKGWQL
jgi:hypothetical protein